jgi:Ycf4
MNTKSEFLYTSIVIGSRTIANVSWACLLLLGTSGFLVTGINSYLGKNIFILGTLSYNVVDFIPQGLVMSFYGTAGFFLSTYLWWTILFNIGSGYNEFDRQSGMISIFRWGFPGQNRKIRVRCLIRDVEAVCIDTNIGFIIKPIISLRLQGKQNLPLNSMVESFSSKEIEKQAAQLAQFLQVPLESR